MESIASIWNQMSLANSVVLILLLILQVWSVFVIIGRFNIFRKARVQSREFAPAVAEALKDANIQEAIDLAEQYESSHLAKVVSAGLQEFRAHETGQSIPGETIAASKRALERATAIGIEDFMHSFNSLSTIGNTSPLLGLLGATIGFLNASSVYASNPEETTLISAGISEALLLTAYGLIVAIPTVWFYGYITRRLEQVIVEMDNSSSELIDYFLKKRGL